MKKRILALMAVLAGAAAGTAVTAVNYYLYRKEKDGPDVSDIKQAKDEEDSDGRSPADDRRETAEDKDEREKLLAEYLRRVESVFGQGKEARMMAASARPIRNTRTGYAYIGIIDASRKTGYTSSDIYHSCMSNNMRGDEWCYITQRAYAKMPKEKVEVETKEEKGDDDFVNESVSSNDVTPAVTQTKSEDKDEEKRLMAEYWRRVENVCGHDKQSCAWAKNAKPIYHARTGYAYIGISDASKKTGYSPSYIHRSCLSNNRKGGAWCYISQTEYARMPEERIEVDTREEKDNDVFLDDFGFHDDATSVTSQEKSEDDEKKLMAEYWRRAKKVFGNDPRVNGWAKVSKPVRNSRTGYVYISVQDAAAKTGTYATNINQSCAKGDEWCRITKAEYAKTPLRKIEVVTKEDAK